MTPLTREQIAGLRELLAKATPVVSHTRIPVPRQTLAALLDIAEAVANAPVMELGSQFLEAWDCYAQVPEFADGAFIESDHAFAGKQVIVLPLSGEV